METRYFNAPRYLLRRHCVRKMLRGIDEGRALDIGCGAGDLSLTLRKKGFDVTGIDYSEDAVDACNARHADTIRDGGLRFLCGNLFDIDGSFDVITMMEVLEHIEDDAAAMRQVSELLNAGGSLLLSVPANPDWFGPYDEYVGHLRRYGREELETVISQAGLNVEAMWSYGVPLANLTEAVRNRVYANKPVLDSEAATKQSGLNRSLEYRIRHLSNDVVLYPFHLIQRLFFATDLGTGLILRAVKR